MSDRAELLIGGWIAGTLTPGERRELLDAAMANQALFDTLADEEGMRELLADPAVRRELSALLARPQASAPARDSWWGWMRHPGSLAAVGVAAVLLVGLVALRPGLTERAMEATQLPTAYVFFGIEEIGVEIEDPLGHDDNDLPLGDICETIHRNVYALAGLESSPKEILPEGL